MVIKYTPEYHQKYKEIRNKCNRAYYWRNVERIRKVQNETKKEKLRLYRLDHPKVYIDWERIRTKVLKRDNFICLNCGSKATEVHHIDASGSNKPKGKWNNKLENLMSVCHRCNILLDLEMWEEKSFSRGKWKEENERNENIILLLNKKSQSEIARELGITRQRVNQIVKRLDNKK